MKLYAVSTPDMEPLRRIFLDSLQDDWQINILDLDDLPESPDERQTTIIERKLDYVLNAIRENLESESVIIVSDLDIQFFGPCTDLLLEAIEDRDLVFMDEGTPDVNTGFFAIRCSEKTVAFFEEVRRFDLSRLVINEQSAINMILRYFSHDLVWEKLPATFWAFTNGNVPPDGIVLHHANCTLVQDEDGNLVNSKEAKLAQLQEIRRQVCGDRVCVIVISKKEVPTAQTLKCLESILNQDAPCSVLFSMDEKPELDKPSNIIWHSNKARSMALATDADFFAFVDTDIVLPPGAISELVTQLRVGDKHIISGWFRVSDDEYNAGRWVADNTLVQLRAVENSVVGVDKIDFGCMLLSREALEACVFITEHREFIHNTEAKAACPCLSFAVNAQNRGYTLWMDGSVVCQHKHFEEATNHGI